MEEIEADEVQVACGWRHTFALYEK